MSHWTPRGAYHYEGRSVTTERDLSNEEFASLQNGEILEMRDAHSGGVAGYLLMDSYGAIRCSRHGARGGGVDHGPG